MIKKIDINTRSTNFLFFKTEKIIRIKAKGSPIGFNEANKPQINPNKINFIFFSKSNKSTIAKLNKLKSIDSVSITFAKEV